jgi:uroporphyrinogen decarboxylase
MERSEQRPVISLKPFLHTLRGQTLGTPPVWLMRQAGRYLPEYRALRQKARDFVHFCLTPELAIEATLQPIRRYQMDAAILFADILLIPHALGQGLTFVEGEGPKLPAIRDAAGLAMLSRDRLGETLEPVMETIRGVRSALPPEVALIGFAGAPWTVATYMVEGEGGTDHSILRRLAWGQPELFARLMDLLVESTSAYLIAQVDAGAEALQLFDTWAGSVPGPLFDAAVIMPAARIVAEVKAHRPDVPIIGFPRGAGLHLARYIRETGVDGVGIDLMSNLAEAASQVPGQVAVQGNLDPMLLLEGGMRMETEARHQVELMRGRPYVFNLGHGVVQQTPPEHVARLVEVVRSAG